MIRDAGGSKAARHSHHELRELSTQESRVLAFSHDQKHEERRSTRKSQINNKWKDVKNSIRFATAASSLASVSPLSASFDKKRGDDLRAVAASSSSSSSAGPPSREKREDQEADEEAGDEKKMLRAKSKRPADSMQEKPELEPRAVRRIGVPGGDGVDYKSKETFVRWYGSSFRAAYNSVIFEAATLVLLARFSSMYLPLPVLEALRRRMEPPNNINGTIGGDCAEEPFDTAAEIESWTPFATVVTAMAPFVMFSLVFYTGQVIRRFFMRFDDMLAV